VRSMGCKRDGRSMCMSACVRPAAWQKGAEDGAERGRSGARAVAGCHLISPSSYAADRARARCTTLSFGGGLLRCRSATCAPTGRQECVVNDSMTVRIVGRRGGGEGAASTPLTLASSSCETQNPNQEFAREGRPARLTFPPKTLDSVSGLGEDRESVETSHDRV
jgi:hypothetical protein